MKSRLHHSPRADTMKCVVRVPEGDVIRVTNEEAHRLVTRDHNRWGAWEYCSKRVFKEYRKTRPDHPERSRINSEDHIVADV